MLSKDLVSRHLAGQTVSVARSAMSQRALANLATWAYHLTADLNVFPARNAHHHRLASISSAKILALELAVEMPNAKWSITTPSVFVLRDGPEIL